MTDAGHRCSCCSGPVSSVHQTLDEMDFERGLLDFNTSDIVICFRHLKPSPSPVRVFGCLCVCVHEFRCLVCSSARRPAEGPVSGPEGNTSQPEGHSWIHCSGVCSCLWLQNLHRVLCDSVFSSSSISNLAALRQPQRSPQRVRLSSGGRRLCVPPNSRWGDAAASCCLLWTRRRGETAAAAQSRPETPRR